MSARAVQAVLASRLPSSLKLTAVCIAWHANDETGLAWMSKGTLALECSATERSVKRHVHELLALGVLKRSRKGGGRITSQYEFDFAALGGLGPLSSDAGVTAQGAEGAARDRDEGGTVAPAAVSPVSLQQCHQWPGAVSPVSLEIDEREPKVPLSSKAPAVSEKPDTTAAGGAPMPEASTTARAARVPRTAKQPPTGTRPKARGKPAPYPWLEDREQLSRRGQELGLQPLEVAERSGMSYGLYLAEAVNRAAAAGEPRVA